MNTVLDWKGNKLFCVPSAVGGFVAVLISLFGCSTHESNEPKEVDYKYEVIADSLTIPWNIEVGPDGYLWVCEQESKLLRISLEDYSQEAVSLIGFDYKLFFTHGLAFQPDFKESGMLFIGVFYFPKNIIISPAYLDVVKAKYDPEKNTITMISTIVDSLFVPASNLPGGRLRISKDNKLLVTACNEPTNMRSQSLDNLSGKILRFNFDGSIPEDNPFTDSPIYTYGHRNPQGLIVMEDGRIFVSEHGPSTDDELNEIIKGENYGWPLVMGKCDTVPEFSICDSIRIKESEYNWTPTIAPSSLVYYDSPKLPSLKGSFLVSTLKENDIRVLDTGEYGEIVEKKIILDGLFGRLRDMAIDTEGYLYVSTGNILPIDRHAYDYMVKDTSIAYDVILKVYE
jgi:glucose/arabinose dehydrogenase